MLDWLAPYGQTIAFVAVTAAGIFLASHQQQRDTDKNAHVQAELLKYQTGERCCSRALFERIDCSKRR